GEPEIKAAGLAAGHENVFIVEIHAVDRLGSIANGGLEVLFNFAEHAADGNFRRAGEVALAAFDARDHAAIGCGDVGFDVDAGLVGDVDEGKPGNILVFDLVVFGFGDGLIGVKLADDGDVAVEQFVGGEGLGDGGFDRIALVGFDFDGLVDGPDYEEAKQDEDQPAHGDAIAAGAAGAFGERSKEAEEAVDGVHRVLFKRD